MIHVRRALLFATLSVANLLVIWSPDVLPASLFAWTVVRQGNVDYDEFTFLDREAYFFRACGASTFSGTPHAARSPGGPPPPGPNDHVCSIFPPGAAILALPAYVPFVLAGHAPDDLTLLLLLGKLVGALEEGIAAALLIAAFARLTTMRWSLLLGLLYLLGTSVRTISSQALWQHGASHVLLAAALLVLVRLFTGAAVSRRALFLAGLCLGFAVVVRQTNAVFAVAALLALVLSRRPFAAAAAGAVVGALPLPLYDLLAFGNVLEQGYGPKPFGTPPLEGLYGLLLSPSRGLFVYAPFLLFALPPLVRAWRSRAAIAPLLRWLGLAALALLLGYAAYSEWWGGRVFGARFLSDALPVLFLALAVAPPVRRRWRVAFAAASAWALLLHNAAAFVYDQRWDTEPTNVNFDPARLFSWADPQWLAVLRDAVAVTPREAVAVALSALVLGVLVFTERDALFARPAATSPSAAPASR